MASDRDTLVELILPIDWSGGSAGSIADAVIGVGWRPPVREITTAAELDELPVYTIGTVGEGVAAQRWPDGWNVNGQRADERSGSDELIEECGPVTIVYVPMEEANRG